MYRKLIKNKPDKPRSYNETFLKFYKYPKTDISQANLTTDAETMQTEASKETI